MGKSLIRPAASPQLTLHLRDVLRRIDGDGIGAEKRHPDPHAAIESAELLQSLRFFQRRGWPAGEREQHVASEPVDSDVLEKVTVRMRTERLAREIQRLALGGDDDFDDVAIGEACLR